MGTFGLWKYVAAHNVQYAADKQVPGGVDHLFLDMNGIMHTCYSKDHPTRSATVKNVLALLNKLFQQFTPRKSLVVVFDGPAPTAKLRTQRERRQSMIRNPQKQELNEAQIVTGSTFVLECEEEVLQYINHGVAGGKIGGSIATEHMTRVSLVGSCVPGEGEIKIAEELKQIFSTAIDQGVYDADDQIVIVGNDSDLILTSIACTAYHNFYVVNPYTFVSTNVGELFAHWVNAVPNRQLHLELLPSYRIDFVFLMLLAGGDHYPGVEDDCIFLWRKYRKLRADGGFFRATIVRGDDINWELLRAVVARDHSVMQHYAGSKNKRKTVQAQGNTAPGEPGLQLLRGARWSLHMLRGFGCSDYYFHHRGDVCKVGNLRSALNGSGVQAHTKLIPNAQPPLTPLQVYCSVIGAPQFLPAAVVDALESSGTLRKFAETLSVGTILSTVKDAFDVVDSKKLTAKERQLMTFGDMSLLIGRKNPEPAASVLASEDDKLRGESTKAATSCVFEYPVDVTEIRLRNLYDSRCFKVSRSKPKKVSADDGLMCKPPVVHVDAAVGLDEAVNS